MLFKKLWEKGQRLIISITAGIFFLANQTHAQHTFSGWVYGAANGVSSDSALVQLVNPSNDAITTKVGRIIPKYWNRTSFAGWINDGDTCKIFVKDTTGQEARTFRITPLLQIMSILFFQVVTLFLLINGVDSVNAKCYSIGPTVWSDTLEGRFRIGIPHDDIFLTEKNFKESLLLV